jgi:elongation factor G
MKPASQLRNLGILAHIDAGKTTLTERILFYTGVVPLMGEVHDGTTVTDWMPQEQERGITITAASISCEWRKIQINLIDTPGHVDFTVEVERSLRVLDGAVAVLSAVDGVQPQTEAVWRQAQHHSLPVLAFINKMDREGADLDQVVGEIESQLGVVPVLFQMPLLEEGAFRGVIDLVRRQAIEFDAASKGVRMKVGAIPSAFVEEAEIAREMLIDAVLGESDPLIDQYLLDGDLPAEAIVQAAGRAVRAGRIVPVFCGSALKNQGVQPLLDAIVDLLPSPSQAPLEQCERGGEVFSLPVDPSHPLVAMVVKRMNDLRVGSVTTLRVFSGTLRSGQEVQNARSGEVFQVGKLVRMLANEPFPLGSVGAGDIASVVDLPPQGTGDTLCEPGTIMRLEPMTFPQPVAFVALEAATETDCDALERAVRELVDEDPTLVFGIDSQTGQVLVRGVGELHLEVLSERILQDYGIECRASKPQVAFLETLEKTVVGRANFSKVINGTLQETTLELNVRPGNRGDGLLLQCGNWVQMLPKDFIRAVEEGIRKGLKGAGSAGFDVVDVEVEIVEILYDLDVSSELSFRQAATKAMGQALRKNKTIGLEPQMRVEIVTPDDYMGAVVGDLSARHGKITQVLAKAKHQVVTAYVPLSTMFGYASSLRSLTQGRASFTMQFHRYERSSTTDDKSSPKGI